MRYEIDVSYHHLDQSRERLGSYPVVIPTEWAKIQANTEDEIHRCNACRLPWAGWPTNGECVYCGSMEFDELDDAQLWEYLKEQAKLAACRQHPRFATAKGGYWEMHFKP